MHNTVTMRGVESVGNRDSDAKRLIERQRPAFDSSGQRFAAQVLHDDVWLDDVGVKTDAKVEVKADAKAAPAAAAASAKK